MKLAKSDPNFTLVLLDRHRSQGPGEQCQGEAGWAARAIDTTVAPGTGTIPFPFCSFCRSRTGDKGAASQLKISVSFAQQL